MKIKIINADYFNDNEILTLRDCGFQNGDIVEVSGNYSGGNLSIKAIRETESVNIGDDVAICECEYEVVEK